MKIKLTILYDKIIKDSNSETYMNELIELLKTGYDVDVEEIEQDENFLMNMFNIIPKPKEEEVKQIKQEKKSFFKRLKKERGVSKSFLDEQ